MSNILRVSGTRTVLSLIFIMLLVSGCRTYGRYGSEEATYQQILKAHQLFQEDLARRQADLRRLESAAGETEVVGRLAMQYAEIVGGHEAVLESEKNEIADLSPASGYRDLHRTLGAIISGHRTIRIQYQGLLTNALESRVPPDTTVEVERPYALIPAYYKRIEGRQPALSVNDVLTRIRTGSEAGVQGGIPAPDMSMSESGPGDSDDASTGDAEGETSSPGTSGGEPPSETPTDSSPGDAAGDQQGI